MARWSKNFALMARSPFFPPRMPRPLSGLSSPALGGPAALDTANGTCLRPESSVFSSQSSAKTKGQLVDGFAGRHGFTRAKSPANSEVLTPNRLLKNALRRHSERSEESLLQQNANKRKIPHFADSVRNDESGVFQQAPKACRLVARSISETGSRDTLSWTRPGPGRSECRIERPAEKRARPPVPNPRVPCTSAASPPSFFT